jgi:hypothetical protein
MATRIRNLTKKVRGEIADSVITDRNIRLVIKNTITPLNLMHTIDAKIEIQREENRIARLKARSAKWIAENPERYQAMLPRKVSDV